MQSIREKLSAEGEEEGWIVDGEIKRRLAAYDLEEKELEERLSLIREEEKKERRARGRDENMNRMRLGTRIDGRGDEEGDRKSKRRVSRNRGLLFLCKWANCADFSFGDWNSTERRSG